LEKTLIEVSVRLGSALSVYRPADQQRNNFDLKLQSDSPVDDLLAVLGIPNEQPLLLIVNDEVCNPEDRASLTLTDGDKVSIMTPLHAG
jgi:sulfur carrier protein ThiS